jgi:hypothetical protein
MPLLSQKKIPETYIFLLLTLKIEIVSLYEALSIDTPFLVGLVKFS